MLVCFLFSLYALWSYNIKFTYDLMIPNISLCILYSFRILLYIQNPLTKNILKNSMINSNISYYFSIIGCWLFSMFYLLDWGDEWLKWPVPSYLGYIIGTILSLLYEIINDYLTYYKKI